jgi:hypothetical protein
MLSEATAASTTGPETMEPVAGAVMRTEGAVTSAALLTTTDTPDDVTEFPTMSLARAVRTYVPFAHFVVSQANV